MDNQRQSLTPEYYTDVERVQAAYDEAGSLTVAVTFFLPVTLTAATATEALRQRLAARSRRCAASLRCPPGGVSLHRAVAVPHSLAIPRLSRSRSPGHAAALLSVAQRSAVKRSSSASRPRC